ncbi:hypothetical protein FIBSPDRAFT_950066 [Athelia psychrophila]|uniref:Fatty acid desaturase domain-containing protein n=1 Tax=Athelia psychrophila TaxID=1759441 RepID=A0A166P2T4_9AGAM|nr:hypothetical protein FIBSPDRAFT_950066 [Fibularhizoctonia sp. CBS 109695]
MNTFDLGLSSQLKLRSAIPLPLRRRRVVKEARAKPSKPSTALQFSAAYLFCHPSPLSWQFVLVAYAIGGTANQNLFLAIQEITHNLTFPGIVPNKLLAVFVNLPIGVPYSAAFKKYHIEHHKHMGADGIDTDILTRFEYCA